MEKTPYPIRLSGEEKSKLKVLAEQERRSMPDWVRAHIYFEFEKLPEDVKQALELSGTAG